MAATETVEVIWSEKFGQTPVVINAEDFDPKIHKHPGEHTAKDAAAPHKSTAGRK